MNEQKQQAEQPRKLRGTATFFGDGRAEFQPQGEGQPVQRSVKKKGDSRFYETEGEKQSSYVAHLKVNKDSTDPAAEMQEQLDYFLKGFGVKEPKAPRSKCLMDEPGVKIWHKKSDNKVVVLMEMQTDVEQQLSTQLFNLMSEINKCFAINQTSLAPRKK